MTRSNVLIARGIHKTLGEGAGRVEALKGVSLTVHPGELTLLMGPSGSGKTTLLSILGCLLSADAGSLEIAGKPIAELSSEQLALIRREHIGFVFQSFNLFPTLTAVENIELCLDVSGTDRISAHKRALEALDSVGLSHRVNAYPRTLSGGEKQRVAIARALVGKPSVILADEPTSALDSENGAAVMKLLSEVSHDSGRAVLAVTHDHRIEKYADRIVQIEDGMIIGSGQPGMHSSDRENDADHGSSNVTPLRASKKKSQQSRPTKRRRTAKSKR